ncbi:hypothetical protein V1511DRAFT_495970 [Dipodascopsis uninucleata]
MDDEGPFGPVKRIKFKHEPVLERSESTIIPRRSNIYAESFLTALNTVLESEAFLFDSTEQKLFDSFLRLSDDSKSLYARLFLRKSNCWFRINSMFQTYTEISDIYKASQELTQSHVFAHDQTTMKVRDDVYDLMTVDELKLMAKNLSCKLSTKNKVEIINQLKEQTIGQRILKVQNQSQSTINLEPHSLSSKMFRQAIDIVGPCIRLEEHATKIFCRVHLVYFRSTEFDKNALTTLILAQMSKRKYADYFICRSSGVFKTRCCLLEYEKALELQEQMDSLMVNLAVNVDVLYELLKNVYGQWEKCLEQEKPREWDRDNYLIRFSAGWIYTRLLYKFAEILLRLHRYKEAYSIYDKLLSQKIYHVGKRGKWYQKKALIETQYMCDDGKDWKLKRYWKEKAINTCELGLQDPETHLRYHIELQRRIIRLEKTLRVLPKDRHIFSHLTLRRPQERTFYGEQISESTIGKRTIWKDLDGNTGSVEIMCLSNYKSQGWRGYFDEGSLLRTIFAYIFWDVIFYPVPFVFETPYQNCPLDLNTDAFYLNRSGLIQQRIQEIENLAIFDHVDSVYESNFEHQTTCIGMNWEYDIKEVKEAIKCIGGFALSIICRVFCEGYDHWSSGLPDLFLWDPLLSKCMFSEVKSENDRLSDHQRVWIDLLCTAGVTVELCHALPVNPREE